MTRRKTDAEKAKTKRTYHGGGRPLKDEAALTEDARELRALRLGTGMSRTTWALLLGVGARTVCGWECGETVPPAPVYKLARIMGQTHARP
jgi:DNA-binding transcriptional regulator YiaG